MATLGAEAFKDLIFHSEKGLVWPESHHCYCSCSLNRSFYFRFSSMNMKDQINRWGSFYQRQNGVAVQGLCSQAVCPAMSLLGYHLGQVT